MPVTGADRELISGVLRRDSAAEAAFVQRYHDRLEWLARIAGVPAKDCDDVVQETLFAAIDQLRRKLFRGKSTLGTWLRVILKGKIEDYKRAQRKVVGPGNPFPDHFKLDTNSELQTAVLPFDHEMSMTVLQILQKMPPKHRDLLILSKIAGFKIKEISQQLKWPAGTIGRIISEAKEMFRKFFEESENFSANQRQSISDGQK